MNLTEKKMNLFDVPENCYLVECISSDFALGAGIAKEFRKRGCVDDDLVTIAMPRIRCGLDRLKWSQVKSLIEEEFKDVENLDIIVCYQ